MSDENITLSNKFDSRSLIYRELPQNRRFGVELEVSNNLTKIELGHIMSEFEELYGYHKTVKVTNGNEGWAQTSRNNYWHVKFDRTCGPIGKYADHGWEIASFIASGVEEIHHIARAARFLANNKAQTNQNCGLHIHVEVNDFTKSEMGILLARWLKIESTLTQICHYNRTGNSYCRSLISRFYEGEEDYFSADPEGFWNWMKPTDLSVHNNDEKCYTLNTLGFAAAEINPNYSRNTIELRLPEGLLEEAHVRNWIKLFLNFIEISRCSKAPATVDEAVDIEEVLIYLGLQGEKEFFVLDHELIGLKMWLLSKLGFSYRSDLAPQAYNRLEFISKI